MSTTVSAPSQQPSQHGVQQMPGQHRSVTQQRHLQTAAGSRHDTQAGCWQLKQAWPDEEKHFAPLAPLHSSKVAGVKATTPTSTQQYMQLSVNTPPGTKPCPRIPVGHSCPADQTIKQVTPMHVTFAAVQQRPAGQPPPCTPQQQNGTLQALPCTPQQQNSTSLASSRYTPTQQNNQPQSAPHLVQHVVPVHILHLSCKAAQQTRLPGRSPPHSA
jgi:hypothetical protein